MTDNPSDTAAEGVPEDAAAESEEPANGGASPAARLAAAIAERVGATSWSADHDTARVEVDPAGWRDAVATVRDEFDLPFFSWLSAVDWSSEVTVGEPVADPENLEERYDVIVRLSSVHHDAAAHLVARLPKDQPSIDSLVPLFRGAEWHEREAHEMFGIDFPGNGNLVKLYLPDAFEGHPMRKSFALLTREVKPWPGTVDVEDMPSTENPEVGDEDGGV